MNNITITPLGTVSPYPKDNMNCPGFLVKYHDKLLLIDCGNGITRLLNFPSDLNNLNVIITHYHKDHYGDIGSIEYASFVYHNLGLLNSKVKVYLPKNDYNYSKESIIQNKESFTEYFDITDNYSFNIDDLEITLHDNKSHSIESFMVSLKNTDFKIVYTSDIGKTNFEDLINFSKNADIFICESSFLQKHNIESNTHLCAYDSAMLAKLSNSKKLLLTHFWPEEDKQLYLNEAKQIFENTDICIENKSLVLRR